MISQFTWPNFRAGSDKDGTQVLIQERNFMHDVKYGKTKIFIRSPATLFALETVRVYRHGLNRAVCNCRFVRVVDRASRYNSCQ
jgi:myosin heavy subunit